MATVVLESTITCPACRASRTQTMPVNACQVRHTCSACGTELRPLAGDCCVFCSYGTVPCPPIQMDATGASCH